MQMMNALAKTQSRNHQKIIMTHVRHKRHMQFLTPAPNFRGSADLPPWPSLPGSEYWQWFRPPAGKKRRILRSSWFTAGTLALALLGP